MYCHKCKTEFTEDKQGVIYKSEIYGGKAWPYYFCPNCGANEGYLDDYPPEPEPLGTDHICDCGDVDCSRPCNHVLSDEPGL